MRSLGLLAALLVVGAGCVPVPSFHCDNNSTCKLGDGTQGICELNHTCSFPDAKCSVTERRYGAEDRATGCVPPGNRCVNGLALAGKHACALRSDGAVLCWGENGFGQLGDGTTTSRPTPTLVVGLPKKATAVAVGEDHSCVILEDQGVWCWGDNSKGNLGLGDTTPATSLAPVPVLTRAGTGPSTAFKATALSAGGGRTCAISPDAFIYCWGENKAGTHGGQCGQDPALFDDVKYATKVEGLESVRQLGAGDEFTCGVRDDNSVWCFGSNETGSLGNGRAVDGTLKDSFVPVAASRMTSVSQLAVGDEHACARKSDSSVFCWGYGGSGSLGLGTLADAETPQRTTNAAAIFSGGGSFVTCALDARVLRCWGQNDLGQTATGSSEPNVTTPAVAQLASVEQVATGGSFVCATTLDGALWCWGSNDQGQLGNNATGIDAASPVRVDFPCP
jgi:alpha-tubulin suppressor-like RCC1 family protein